MASSTSMTAAKVALMLLLLAHGATVAVASGVNGLCAIDSDCAVAACCQAANPCVLRGQPQNCSGVSGPCNPSSNSTATVCRCDVAGTCTAQNDNAGAAAAMSAAMPASGYGARVVGVSLSVVASLFIVGALLAPCA